jgi:hypothetical protein
MEIVTRKRAVQVNRPYLLVDLSAEEFAVAE